LDCSKAKDAEIKHDIVGKSKGISTIGLDARGIEGQ
jgi:hypothetical protein